MALIRLFYSAALAVGVHAYWIWGGVPWENDSKPRETPNIPMSLTLEASSPREKPAAVIALPEDKARAILPRDEATDVSTKKGEQKRPLPSASTSKVTRKQSNFADVNSPVSEKKTPRRPTSEKTSAKETSLAEKGRTARGNGAINASAAVGLLRKAIPVYRRNPAPNYPPIARRKGYEGTVIVEVLVSAQGEVSKLRLHQSSGHRMLDKQAMKAVRRWIFEPALQGNEKIEMWVKVPVRFRLN